MSQENVEIVRQAWEAFMRRDNEAALALYDPEVEVAWRSIPLIFTMRGGKIIQIIAPTGQRLRGLRQARSDDLDTHADS